MEYINHEAFIVLGVALIVAGVALVVWLLRRIK